MCSWSPTSLKEEVTRVVTNVKQFVAKKLPIVGTYVTLDTTFEIGIV